MPATLVIMTRIHDQSKPAFDFKSDNVRVEHGIAGSTHKFPCGQDGWNKRATGMRHRHETHVVIVVRMRRDAVCKGSIARTGANARSKHPAVASRFRHA